MKKALVCGVAVMFAGLAQAQDVGSEKTVSLKLAHDMVVAAVEDCSSKGYNVVAVVVAMLPDRECIRDGERDRPARAGSTCAGLLSSAVAGSGTTFLAEGSSFLCHTQREGNN